MSIASLEFAGFVLLVLAAYHLLPQRARMYWLLLASYVFYAIESWRFVPVLLVLTVVNFAVAGRLTTAGRHTAWLFVGLAANLAALGGLRYAYRLDPFAGPFVVTGLSFYSLQAISYLLDMRAGVLRTRGRLADVALYLAYFPKLIAGPIERARVFLPQLERPGIVDERVAARAGTLIVVGVTRKLVIADPLRALLPEQAFSSPSELGAAVLAAAIVGYAFALYNDFASYTSIVRGVSSLFGIELSANFQQPFFARSFSDFWNRWHITLSHWLRDYVYLPLSRALLRRNQSLWNVPNLILPPIVTMLAAGLWHGAGSHMLLWGGLHGLYLIVERVLTLWSPTRARNVPAWRQAAGAVIVFLLGSFSLVAFRAETSVALAWWSTVLSGAPGALPDGRMAWYIVPSLWMDWMEHRHGAETAFDHWPRLGRAALLGAAVLLWFLVTRTTPGAPFIYRGF